MENREDKSFDNFDIKKKSKKKLSVMRQCCIQKIIFPRSQMIRLVKTPEGSIVIDFNHDISGRGIHFWSDAKTVSEFWNPRRRKMVAHFLRTEISEQKWQDLSHLFFLSINTSS